MAKTVWINLNENDPAEALLLSVLKGVKKGMRSRVLTSLLFRYLDDYAIPLGDVDKIIRCVEFYCKEGLPPKIDTLHSRVPAEGQVALLTTATQNTEKKVKSASRKAAINERRIEHTGGTVLTPALKKTAAVGQAADQLLNESIIKEESERNPDIPKWKDENGRPIPMDRETSLRFKELAPKEYKEYLNLLLNTRA